MSPRIHPPAPLAPLTLVLGVALAGVTGASAALGWTLPAAATMLGSVFLARRARPRARFGALLTAYLLLGLSAWPAPPPAPEPGTLLRLEGRVLDSWQDGPRARVLLRAEEGARYRLVLPARYADGRPYPLPNPGSRVMISGVAGPAPRAGPPLLRVKSPVLLTLLEPGGGGRCRWRRAARGRLRDLLAPPGTGAPGALLRAMVLGEREALPPRSERDLRAAGLSHLLAVSGLHVGMVAGALFLLGRLSGLGSRGSLALSALGALLYGALVGGRPPVLRAVGMLSAGVAGGALGRRARGITVLGWAAGAIALLLPEEVLRPGYQLSFVACAALILGAGGHGPRWRRLVVACLAAQLGSLPLVLFHFGRIAPFALAANLAGLPLASLIVGGSLALPLLDLVSPAAGELAGGLPRGAAGLLLFLAELVAELPGSGRMLAPVGLLWCLTASVTVLAALGSRGPGRFLLWTLYTLLLLGGPLRPERAVLPAGALEIVALDVGQGSSLLVTTGEGLRLLVDGGGSPGSDYPVGERVLLPQLRRLGVRHLDVVALTHPDADHGEGLEAVIEALPVGRLVLPGEDCGHPLARRLAARAARRGVPTEGWWAGRREGWEGLTLLVLGPEPGAVCGENDDSLVLRLVSPGGALLLPGDVEGEGEGALLASGASLEARVLVLPHHGGAGSSGPDFLDRVRPELAVVQAGARNPFGHPHARVLEALRNRGVRLFRTDRDGAVRVLLLPDGRLRSAPLTRRSEWGSP